MCVRARSRVRVRAWVQREQAPPAEYLSMFLGDAAGFWPNACCVYACVCGCVRARVCVCVCVNACLGIAAYYGGPDQDERGGRCAGGLP